MIGCLKAKSFSCLRFEAFSHSVIAEKHQRHMWGTLVCLSVHRQASADVFAFKKAVKLRTE